MTAAVENDHAAPDAGPETTPDDAAQAAEDAALEAIRLVIAAYSRRARVASRLALARLGEARADAAEVADDDGDWALEAVERAAREACLYALEANVLARIHRRLSEQWEAQGSLTLFDTLDEDTQEMLKERDEIIGWWDQLDG